MDKKPKLCFVIPEYNRKTPTHFNYLYDFIKKLASDFRVYLIAEKGVLPGNLGFEAASLFLGFTRLRVFEIILRLLWARARGYKDFYVHYSFFSAFAASIIVKLFGGRVFYWNCGEPWKYKRDFLRENFERTAYKMVTYLVTGTDSLAKAYSKKYGIPIARVKIMPNWIDLKDINVRLPRADQGIGPRNDVRALLHIAEDEKIILFAHRLSERKGAQYLPDILERLKNEPVVMVVAGDGPLRENIESRIKNLGLESKVRFLGWVPQEKIDDYFSIADVFLMPSDEEGFPHVMLEAMSIGVPFAASDVGGVKDIVPREMLKYVISDRTPEKFAIKLKELLNLSEVDRQLLKQIMRRHVERYDIDRVIKIFVEMMNG